MMATSHISLFSELIQMRRLERALGEKEESVGIDGPSAFPPSFPGDALSTLFQSMSVNDIDQAKSSGELSWLAPDGVESIPDSIGDLTNLQFLKVTGKHLKSLPHSLEKLHALQTLIVNDCPSLVELPPNLNKLTGLTNLLICRTPITSLPKSMMGLPNLRTLLLQDCLGLEELPENINELVSLEELRLWNTNLKSLPNNLRGLSNLLNLELVECFSLEALPENLNELVSLKKFPIYGTHLKSLPNTIARLPNLQTLRIRECFSLGELPENLNELVNLKKFEISRVNLKSLPNTITGLHNLRIFNLSECSTLEELPENLNELVSLTELRIWDTSIKSLPDSITGLTNLEILDIKKCYGLIKLPTNLNGLVSLRCLSIRDTKIRSLPSSISKLQNLRELDLRCCYDIEELPASLYQLTNLRIKFPRENEELGDYVAVPPPGLETLNEDGIEAMAVDGEVTTGEDSSDDERINSKGEDHPNMENGHMLNSTSHRGRAKRLVTLQDIQPCLDKKMTLVDTAEELGVSRSTLKRKWKEFKRGPWPSSRQHDSATKGNSNTKPPLARKSSRLGLGTPTSRGHASPSTWVVKVTYKDDITRFEIPCVPSFVELKEEVGKRLNLDSSSFKMKYKDEEQDMVMMTSNSDLQHCLRLAIASRSNIVKLTAFDL